MSGLFPQADLRCAHLFVYGTLRRGCLHHHRLRDAEFLGPGTVQGRLYRISWYPGLVPAQTGLVRGEVYRLRNPAGTLPALDGFEGGEEFERAQMEVEMDGGRRLPCWAYVYHGAVAEHRLIRSGDFLLG